MLGATSCTSAPSGSSSSPAAGESAGGAGGTRAAAPGAAASGGSQTSAEAPNGNLPLAGRAGSAGGAADADAGTLLPTDAGAPRLAIRGVCWNPVRVGATHPEGLDYLGFSDTDIPLMVELGVNVVRTYEPLLDRAVLDRLWAAGIRVIESVYPYGGVEASVVTERVRAVKDHPAVLYWALGNEWNYNGLYVGLSFEDTLARLNEAAALVRAEDATHPIATIYGELPTAETIAAMPDIDVWGINAYRGVSFGDLFDAWRALSDKPLFIAEYGADAYNANLPGYDPQSQALATEALTREILERAAATSDAGIVLGGTIFEWADEWWKDAAGSLTEQEVGGIAPGGGPYPDQVFNEEWWGIVDIERVPRPAYERLRSVFSEFGAR
ncbi:MAG TPA: glycoside hydrolase family 2 TIM barrel-domain containing protein [Polyangiaceae bacterium]|nr:glycoside hydrolase family 2 TIM barrel-domain containing protein [Polyangiaceae bacterium]